MQDKNGVEVVAGQRVVFTTRGRDDNVGTVQRAYIENGIELVHIDGDTRLSNAIVQPSQVEVVTT